MIGRYPLYPLRFHPVLRRYIWGGRRLQSVLGKTLGPENDWAESWEICDLALDQSIVAFGPLAGSSLGQLVIRRGTDMLGQHYPQPRFPLLLKFLDAARTLSVQVHPNDTQAARLNPPEPGKTEGWVILDAEPGSKIYAGLKPDIDRKALTAAIREGRCEECLHVFEPTPGDCVFLPAGTVHALGAGLLVAEIQQSSSVTYRLFDWNRLGADGRPRPLHIQQGIDATDFHRGPVSPLPPRPTDRPHVARLIECDKFILDRWTFDAPQSTGGDARFRILAVLEGAVAIEGDPSGVPLPKGGAALLPAALGEVRLTPQGKTVLLEAYLP